MLNLTDLHTLKIDRIDRICLPEDHKLYIFNDMADAKRKRLFLKKRSG